MRHGDAAKGERLVRAGSHGIRHTVGATDDKDDVAVAAQRKLIEALGELLARALLTLDGEKDHMRAIGNRRENRRPLAIARSIDAAGTRRVDIGNLAHLNLGIAAQTLEILGTSILPKTLFKFAYSDNGVFHRFSPVTTVCQDTLSQPYWRL